MRFSIGSPKSLAARLLSSTSDSESTEAKRRNGPIGRYSASAFLAFFFHRVIRCGPKLLYYPVLLLISLLVLIRYLPTDFSDSIASGTQHLWSFRPGTGATGGHGSKTVLHPGENNAHDALIGGGLRIVVFGENDIATSVLPSVGDPLKANNGTSWTRELCIELGCTTYMSYVPVLDTPRRSLSSNALYGMFTDEVLRDSKDKAAADDFSFISNEYPNSIDTPDLYTQVNRFLGQPPPQRAPKETVYVFTPGMWDVWSLAAFSEDKAQSYLMSLVFDLFMIIEMLYDAAHNPKSIAYSNYTQSPIGDKATNQMTSTIVSRAGRDSELDWEDETTQPFRVVVPFLFDPSLVPGWKLDRPRAPALHTESEQMRNAVRLTKRWNDHVADEMSKWVKKNTTFVRPEDRARSAAEAAAAAPAAATIKIKRDVSTAPEASPKKRRDDNGNGNDNENSSNRAPSPTLLRDGVIFRMADYLMDIIIDSQMQTQGLSDSKGFGKFSKVDRFLEVSKSCVVPEPAGLPAAQLETTAEFRFESDSQKKKMKEDADNQKEKAGEKGDKSTSDAHADSGAHNDTEKADSKSTSRLRSKREEQQNNRQPSAVKANVAVPSPSPVKKMLVCTDPDSHLFYTPFNLGQRAIEEVGRIAAAVLRAKQKTRSSWDTDRKSRFERDREPASWKKYFDRR
ncbi:hypothetical protein SEPCBS57363_000122 [Sporothrix epigloea]|uniref:Uncharacterized protein n=1 Tax=Sporothrix epigloea TaxID=1892477 RepID=A0ABP0D2V8_9PEZI